MVEIIIILAIFLLLNIVLWIIGVSVYLKMLIDEADRRSRE